MHTKKKKKKLVDMANLQGLPKSMVKFIKKGVTLLRHVNSLFIMYMHKVFSLLLYILGANLKRKKKKSPMDRHVCSLCGAG